VDLKMIEINNNWELFESVETVSSAPWQRGRVVTYFTCGVTGREVESRQGIGVEALKNCLKPVSGLHRTFL
jgi:hypothetical protein